MKKLYLIRHGISQHNILFKNFGTKIFYDKRYYDTKLTGQGIEQSLHLGNTWKDKHFIDCVFCSSLTRTLETANNIFKDNLDIPIYALDILKEFPQGLHTCNKRSNIDQLKKEFPRINFSLIQDNEDIMWDDTKEEPLEKLNDRIFDFKEFIKNRPEKNIAMIGHNSFIGQMMNNHIPLIENGDEELKHCYPYEYKLF